MWMSQKYTGNLQKESLWETSIDLLVKCLCEVMFSRVHCEYTPAMANCKHQHDLIESEFGKSYIYAFQEPTGTNL
jgi:hypothetical protein